MICHFAIVMPKRRILPPRKAREAAEQRFTKKKGVDHLSRLSLDVASVLWKFCDAKTMVRALSVCKAFRKQIVQPVLWKNVHASHVSGSLAFVDGLSRMPLLELSFNINERESLDRILSSLPSLRVINVIRCASSLFLHPVAWPRSLERVTLCGAEEGVGLVQSLVGHPLKELIVRSSSSLDAAVPALASLPLEKFSIASTTVFQNDDSIGSVLEGLAPTLTDLDLSCGSGVDSAMRAMRAVERLPHLRRFCLHSYALITEALRHLPTQVDRGRLSPNVAFVCSWRTSSFVT